MQISGAIRTATNVTPAWPGHTGPSVNAHLGQWGLTQAFSNLSFESVTSEAIWIKGGTATVCPLSACIKVLFIHELLWPYVSHVWHVFPLFSQKALLALHFSLLHELSIRDTPIPHSLVSFTNPTISLSMLTPLDYSATMNEIPKYLTLRKIKLVKYAYERTKPDQADKYGISSAITQLYSTSQFSSLA